MASLAVMCRRFAFRAAGIGVVWWAASATALTQTHAEPLAEQPAAPILDLHNHPQTQIQQGPVQRSQAHQLVGQPAPLRATPLHLVPLVPTSPTSPLHELHAPGPDSSHVVPAQAVAPSQPVDAGAGGSSDLGGGIGGFSNLLPTSTQAANNDSGLSSTTIDNATPARTSDAGVTAASAEALERATPPSLVSTPSVDIVQASEIQSLGLTETADVLQQSTSVQTVDVKRQSPIDFDPRIRGFHSNQIHTTADGAFWAPARTDLDSILSKIDPSLIEDVVVVPGPYGLRYGPGFGFIDIVTSPTPRYRNSQFHGRTAVTARENGGQLYGRQTIYGGGQKWGAIFNYGNRTGSDYRAGDGRLIPSSYQAQNFLGQVGFDLSDDSKIEVRYQRLDQTDTEYAGQFFDLDALKTDSYSVGYTNREAGALWHMWQVDGWYNRTEFNGDTRNQSKRNFQVVPRVEDALGFGFDGETNGAHTTAGARSRMVFGEEEMAQLALGADFRYQKKGISERFTVFDTPGGTSFGTELLTSRYYDPGLYAELTLPWHQYITTTMGARVDWAHTTAYENDFVNGTSLPGAVGDLSQDDVLYGFFLANEVDLTTHWKTRFGFGHAQRAPTLIDRYADGLFLGILQSGFSRVVGNPLLQKERVWQADATLYANYDCWNMRLGAFHSWILDYITYRGNTILEPSGARLLRTINGDVATLTGAEMYAERTYWDRFTLFASGQYVDGRDRQIDAPLVGISPIEGRTGFRLLDPDGGKRWGLEMSARFVAEQDRLGALRLGGPQTTTSITTLELPTSDFVTLDFRSYINVTRSLHVVAGIDNITDEDYLEHLNLRLPDDGQFTGTAVMEPGITPYASIEWTY